MTQFITYNSLKTYVEQHIGEWIVKKILREIKLTKDELWGLVKTRSWAAKTIYVTLYHDLENPSYLSLTNRVVRFYKLTSRSLKRNVHYCRHKLKAWGKSVCTVVPSSTLQKNGIMFHSHYFTGKVTLWTDTTDIRVTGKDRMSRYDPNYSYKVSGPGRKFFWQSMTLRWGRSSALVRLGQRRMTQTSCWYTWRRSKNSIHVRSSLVMDTLQLPLGCSKKPESLPILFDLVDQLSWMEKK